MPGASRLQAETTDREEGDEDSKAATKRLKEMKLGMNGPFTPTEAVGGRSMPDNRSDEEILGEEYRVEVDTDDAEDGGGRGNIQVINTWTVDQSSPAGSRGGTDFLVCRGGEHTSIFAKCYIPITSRKGLHFLRFTQALSL